VEALNAADPGPDLAVRIGVNTGEAIVSIGTREGEGLIAGDMVNTAARLQTAAATNSILVGEETYRCTSSTLDYEPVEPLTVKGKEAPVQAWRVLGAPLPPGERAAPDVPMVGREQELAALMGVWDRVVAERHPHLVTVFGLPGVGKSRLAAEFVATVRDAGAQVLLGRSLPYGESGAYGAFAQQVKRVAGVLDSDPTDAAAEKLRSSVEGLLGAEDADELTAHVAMMLGLPSSGAADDDDVSDRHVLFYSARRLVEALGNDRPTVLVFQDLHWADSSLLDLIEQLGTRVENTPVMLLALARPELHGKRPGWGGKVQASVALSVDPLDAEGSRELATRLLAHTSAAGVDAPVEEICDVGEGNPLFIEELVASVAERSSPEGVELPSSVRGIIAARLDAIPAPERSLLLDASVVGRIFWNGALAQVAPNEGRLPELLDSLEGRDLVRREPVSRFGGQQQFRFKHSLIREVAYAALPRPKRREAHAAVAGFLEQVHAEHDSPAALAHHWLEAGDRERAADYFVAAAEQASRGWAKEEAVAHYRQALELVGKEDKERYRELRLKLVVAQQTLWHKLDAEQIAERQGRGAAS